MYEGRPGEVVTLLASKERKVRVVVVLFSQSCPFEIMLI